MLIIFGYNVRAGDDGGDDAVVDVDSGGDVVVDVVVDAVSGDDDIGEDDEKKSP